MAQMSDSLYLPGLFSNMPTTLSLPPNRPNSSTTSSRADLYTNRDRSAADTLRFVLVSSHSSPGLSHHDRRLIESFQAASISDKAFVASVSNCSKDLQEWCEELETWGWNGSFEDLGTKHVEMQMSGSTGEIQSYNDTELSVKNAAGATIQHTGSYGGLSAQKISVYQKRLQEIQGELEKIDMEEMKHHALTTHLRGDLMASEAASTELHSQPSHARLDVLSALVTVTLLESLPHYSRVISLTQIWAARIAVLDLIPGFSASVEDTKAALDSAWQCIDGEAMSLSNVRFERLQIDLEEKVAGLGQTIDFMLDALESFEDTLPEKWVDIVEALEVDYSAWTVAARKILLEYLDDHDSIPDLPPSPQLLSPLENLSETIEHVEMRRIGTSSAIGATPDLEDTNIIDFRDHDRNLSPTQSDTPNVSISSAVDRFQTYPTDLTSQQYVAQIQAGFDFQTSSAQKFGFLHASAHSRGPSVESVDSVIANPDGSHKFPVLRRQSMYRTASTASFGPISSSQIRSVDLGRSANRAAFLRRDLLPAQIKLSDTTSDPIVSFQELASTRSLESLQATADDINDNQLEQLEPSSSAISAETLRSSPIDEREYGFQNGLADSYGNEMVGDIVKSKTYLSQKPSDLITHDHNTTEPFQEPPLPDISKESSVPDEAPTGTLSYITTTPDRPPQFSITSISTDEQLDRRIGRILTSIPARINFSRRTTNGSGSTTATPSSERATTPSLTLSPAEQREPRAARSSGDSAIKVYHLYQEGRPHPIKLYVRLVGESGERVMVRVGGGWADLGEYLRDYASHHSRTVVPQPNAPLQAVDLQQPGNTRVFSLPIINNEHASPTSPISESPTAGKRLSGQGKPRTAALPGDTLHVPANRSRHANSVQKDRSVQDMALQLEDQDQDQNQQAPATEPESSLHGDEAEELETATGRLTEEKKQWLKDMVSKAKKWRAEGGASRQAREHENENETEREREEVDSPQGSPSPQRGFGDMGSVGSTRRLYRVSDTFKSTAR